VHKICQLGYQNNDQSVSKLNPETGSRDSRISNFSIPHPGTENWDCNQPITNNSLYTHSAVA